LAGKEIAHHGAPLTATFLLIYSSANSIFFIGSSQWKTGVPVSGRDSLEIRAP